MNERIFDDLCGWRVAGCSTIESEDVTAGLGILESSNENEKTESSSHKPLEQSTIGVITGDQIKSGISLVSLKPHSTQ